MSDFLTALFSSDFMPHGHCYLWKPEIVWLHLFPGPGALAVVFWIGAYALVSGSLLIALGMRLRTWQRPLARHHAAHATA